MSTRHHAGKLFLNQFPGQVVVFILAWWSANSFIVRLALKNHRGDYTRGPQRLARTALYS